MINDPVFQPGNRVVHVKKAQILRGVVNRWSGANRFLKYATAPFNALIGYADGAGTWVRCEDDQMWISLWNLVKFLIKCSQGHATWDVLFGGSLLDLIPISKRLSSPIPECKVMWETGDSAMGRFAAINWATKEFIVEDSVDYLDDVNPKKRRVIISDAEQLAATSIVLTWGESETVLFMGTDNQNVLAWPNNGFAKLGVALTLNQEAEEWVSRRKIVAEGFYLRSGYNFSADLVSRTNLDAILEWGNQSVSEESDSRQYGSISFQTGRKTNAMGWNQAQRCSGGRNRVSRGSVSCGIAHAVD